MATIGLGLALILYLALAVCERPARWVLTADFSTATTRRPRDPLWLIWVLLSLALGLLTHIVWDSLTHSDGWVVESLVSLRGVALGSFTWARVLQHLSTGIGLTVLLLVAWRHRGAWLPSSGTLARARFLRVMAVVVTAAGSAMAVVIFVRHEAGAGTERLLSSAAIGAGLGAAGAVAGLSLLWWVARPDKPRTQREGGPASS